MIHLCLNGGGAFGLDFERSLQVTQHGAQLCETPFDGSVELDAASLGSALANSLLGALATTGDHLGALH